MRNSVVGSILVLEGIRAQSEAPECLLEAIRLCKSLNILQKVFTKVLDHKNTVVGSILVLEGIWVQLVAPECPFKAIRPC